MLLVIKYNTCILVKNNLYCRSHLEFNLQIIFSAHQTIDQLILISSNKNNCSIMWHYVLINICVWASTLRLSSSTWSCSSTSERLIQLYQHQYLLELCWWCFFRFCCWSIIDQALYNFDQDSNFLVFHCDAQYIQSQECYQDPNGMLHVKYSKEFQPLQL